VCSTTKNSIPIGLAHSHLRRSSCNDSGLDECRATKSLGRLWGAYGIWVTRRVENLLTTLVSTGYLLDVRPVSRVDSHSLIL